VTFLRTASESEASGSVAAAYQANLADQGYIMNAARAWTTKPEIQAAWGGFYGAVNKEFSLPKRDFQLITFIAAKYIRSTYCSLQWGKALLAELGSPEQVIALEHDFRTAGLNPREVAMLEYVEQISTDAGSIQPADIERLREHGFSDENIYDIAMCASLRHFISRFFDAVGALPDPQLAALPEDMLAALTVGRPFDAHAEL
jgi:uncharacterized peroxidase-related enzyme